MATGSHDDAVDKMQREQLLDATELLRQIASNKDQLAVLSVEERTSLLNAAGDVFCADPDERRLRQKARRKQRRADKVKADEDVLAETGIRKLRDKPVFTTPNVFPPVPPEQVSQYTQATQADVSPTENRNDSSFRDSGFREVVEKQHCYVCKAKYTAVHHFYDQLCPECADFNFAKRGELADLSGQVVLLTGGRVKIGYQAGIKMLRCGADLIVVTRFPRDAAARYAAEADFDEWGDRLEVFGLDLRHTPSVEAFASHVLATRDRLDVIINNACQTVRRPPDFYRHMMDGETKALADLDPAVLGLVGGYEGLRRYDILPGSDVALLPGNTTDAHHDLALGSAPGLPDSAEMSQTPLLPEELESTSDLFPEGRLDQDLQQVDLRDRNSWRLLLHEVSTVELVETQLVNAVAPFVLNARLKPLMEQTPGDHKHVVNVSAVEGQFYRRYKTTKHPHTNMAKAALNMMTRTSAADYHSSGIHMNSVDTGWVSDEDPVAIAEAKTAEHRFHPPLDIVDGAARIVDPVIVGANTGEHVWGQFLKDYVPTDW